MSSPSNNNNNNSTVSPPIPNRPNPKPRNSESIDPLRRSFGANPFPPHSRDVSRRNSFGGSRERVESNNDKENEITTTTPKPSKHFMSPTISAVSKINASPRKRAVLSDKNELSRSVEDVTTVSFSESYDMTVTDIDEVEGVVYSDPRFRISPKADVPYTSPEVVGVGSVLLPPYDPKRNYLSPRPQFLHYKPNPRVEECKQLDELFVSESSCSETDVFTEEEDVEEVEVESVEVMVCERIEEGGAESVEVGETGDVEQLEVETDEEVMVCERNQETSQVPKQSGFRKMRFFGWFLALVLGCMLVSTTFSPPTELLKGLSSYEFHIPREVTGFARANNLEKLSGKLWTMTELSFAYVDKLILRIGGKEEKYGPLQFHNLTYTLEDYTVFQPTSVEISVAELDHQEPEELLQEKSQGENNVVEDGYVSEFEEETGEEQKSEMVCEVKDGEAETNNEIDEETEIKPGTDIELNEGEGNSATLLEASVEQNIEEQSEPEFNPEVNGDTGRRESQEMVQDVSTEKLESEANIDQHSVESDASINVELQKENEVPNTESEAIYINQHDVESEAAINVDQPKEKEVADVESGSETSDDLRPRKTDHDVSKAVIVLSIVLVLLGAVAFLFAKKAKPVATSATGPVTTEELNLSHEPVENRLMKEKLSSLSFEVDDVDDTTSSSFHKKSSFQSNNRDTKSGGGKKRRESMASSASEYSVGSFSYGSFTTYEKIPIKSGDREEEMITPVRRSSRLRNNQL